MKNQTQNQEHEYKYNYIKSLNIFEGFVGLIGFLTMFEIGTIAYNNNRTINLIFTGIQLILCLAYIFKINKKQDQERTKK